MSLPVNLEHVKWQNESWDFGRRRGIAFELVDPIDDTFILRHAAAISNVKVIRPATYRTEEVRIPVFDLADFLRIQDDDDDGALQTSALCRDTDGFFVTQTHETEVDPGETRHLTPAEAAEAEAAAKEVLIVYLGHIRRAGQLLAPRDEDPLTKLYLDLKAEADRLWTEYLETADPSTEVASSAYAKAASRIKREIAE